VVPAVAQDDPDAKADEDEDRGGEVDAVAGCAVVGGGGGLAGAGVVDG
jgi:hypothetical protein